MKRAVNHPNLLDTLASHDRVEAGWTPDTPPDLTGITDLQLNFETTGLKWWDGDRPISMALRVPDGRTWYLPWGHRGGGNLDEGVCKTWAQEQLKGKHITNSNTRFEVHMAREWGVDLEEQGNTVSDVQHYAALLDDYRKRFALDILAKDYLGGVEVGRLDERRMADYHASQAAPRSMYNVKLVAQLRDVMWPELDKQDLQRVRQLEDDVIYPVCEMERNGLKLDVEKLEAWCKASEQDLFRSIMLVHRETGLNINPDSSTDLARLFKQRGLPITEFTPPSKAHPNGQPSFTGAVLSAIEDPVVKEVLRAGRLADLRSKYLVKYNKGRTGDVLRFALHQLRTDDKGTVRGRFSGSELVAGVGANPQQVLAVEKQIAAYGDQYLIRELMIPADGLDFVSADAMQIELRLMAHYAEAPKIIAAYRADPQMNYHKFVWEMLKRFKADLGYKPLKNLNFAYIYGAGLIKIALMMGYITDAQASYFYNEAEVYRRTYRRRWEVPDDHPLLGQPKQIKALYDREFPEVAVMLRQASQLAEKRGYVRTLEGRRARFFSEGRINQHVWEANPTNNRYHSAFNAVDQGSAADIMKKKMVSLHRARRRIGFTPRVSVHDEICGDCAGEESRRLIQEVLSEQDYDLNVDIHWDVGIGPNWAQAKA